MSPALDARPLLVVVGGCGGLVGRAVLREFGATHRIRSVHRRPVPDEQRSGVDWRPADAGRVADWGPYLDGADTVLATAWYRHAPARRFAELAGGLRRLIQDASVVGVRRFLHVSVPPAPARLETALPYLREKRTVDDALASSPLDYAIVRPTMLFGPGDKLLTVLLRLAHRYRRLPMFEGGRYHVSPLASTDLARILRQEGERGGRRTVTVGGPERWSYHDLTDRLFAALGQRPKYVRFSRTAALRLAWVLESVGSSLLYRYEVEWLVSDLLGVPPYDGLDPPLQPVGPFLDDEARRLRASRGGAAPEIASGRPPA